VDKRIFGLSNSFSVVFSARQLSPEETGRRLFGPVASGGLASGVVLRNGGRLHLGASSRPVYATPDCGSAPDLVVHDKAGERILEGLAGDARQRLREEGDAGDISVLKISADPAGSSYGCQEDYTVARGGEFGRLADVLIPFLVTRQLICGAGAVLQTPRGAVYCLSRPAGLTGTRLSSAGARPRPFITTRDESRAAGLRRLRVTVSDPAMSETTMLLKAGATQLVLRMAEAATVPPTLTLASPVQALGEVAATSPGGACCGWPTAGRSARSTSSASTWPGQETLPTNAARTRTVCASSDYGSGRWTQSGRATLTPSPGRSAG
jgi:proteasome accessory factor A